MSKYHKINSPFKRDMENTKDIIIGDWAVPEFEFLKDAMWSAYEKIDGTNIRIIYDGSVEFAGRTDKALIPDHLLTRLRDTFTVEKLSTMFPDLEHDTKIVLYGEGTGYKIQKGCKYFGGRKEVGFILFDIKIGNWWLTKRNVELLAFDNNIMCAPHVSTAPLLDLMKLVSLGQSSVYGDFYSEGIVATPELQLFSRNGQRVITKIKHKDFYRKCDEVKKL